MSKVMAVNAGSSSLKFKLFLMPQEEVLTEGVVERIGMEDAIFNINLDNPIIILIHDTGTSSTTLDKDMSGHFIIVAAVYGVSKTPRLLPIGRPKKRIVNHLVNYCRKMIEDFLLIHTLLLFTFYNNYIRIFEKSQEKKFRGVSREYLLNPS